MANDLRQPLPKGYDFNVNDNKSIHIKGIDLIGRGGSCLVYKGIRRQEEAGTIIESTVIIKEFYPIGVNLERTKDNSLRLVNAADSESFDSLKKNFLEGNEKHSRFFETYKAQILPQVIEYKEQNGTVYAVFNASKGKVLTDINFSTLTLFRIASIMESVCNAIQLIHVKSCLYLDCKSDNFFFYGTQDDLQWKVYIFDFNTVIPLKTIRHGTYVFCSASEGWVPPEQCLIMDKKTGFSSYAEPNHMGYHTDIYSIGVLFFWLLTQRKPSADDINKIIDGKFDWEKESKYCTGLNPGTMSVIQEIGEKTLQPLFEVREKSFPNAYSIREKLIPKFQALHGLTAGISDNQHYKPIVDIVDEVADSASVMQAKIDQLNELIQDGFDQLKSPNYFALPENEYIYADHNRFLYNLEGSDFIGRTEEMEYLLRMCLECNYRFCWTAICGCKGIGKSRLVYELSKKMKDYQWETFFTAYSGINISNIKDTINSLKTNILICLDNVKGEMGEVIELINYFSEIRENINYKIRLIIVDQDLESEYISFSNVSLFHYVEKEMLNYKFVTKDGYIQLGLLDEEQTRSIIQDFALKVEEVELSDEAKDSILEYVKKIDTFYRPIYVLYSTDAWCKNQDPRKWDINDAVKIQVNNWFDNVTKWIKRSCESDYDRNRMINAFSYVITFSSFSGKLELTVMDEMLKKWYDTDSNDNRFLWLLIMTGIYSDNRLTIDLPELMKMYISLCFINSLTKCRAVSFIDLVIEQSQEKGLKYGFDICEEYDEDLIAPSNMSIFQYLLSLKDEYKGINEEGALNRIIDIYHKKRSFIFDDKNSVDYTGDYIFDWKCGRGKKITSCDFIYEGEWNKNLYNGKGKLIESNGNIYEGLFKNGKFNGMGKMIWIDGNKYEGTWKDGYMDGKGVVTFSEGNRYRRYEGEFEKHLFNGKGKLTFSNGNTYEGTFDKSNYIKWGRLILKDGRILEGGWYKESFYSFIISDRDLFNNNKDLTYSNGKIEYPISVSNEDTLLARIAVKTSDTLDEKTWGPERKCFSLSERANYTVFNSITDNPFFGDERSFVRIGEIKKEETVLDTEVEIVRGRQYLVVIYVHNNASSNLNPLGKGIARGVKVAIDYQSQITLKEGGTIKATIISTSTNPKEVWSCVKLSTSEKEVNLRYILASARLINNFALNKSIFSTSIFTKEGAYLGCNKRTGQIPGGDPFDAIVGFVLQAE